MTPSSDTFHHDIIRNRADYAEFLAADLEAHGLRRWRWFLKYKHPELHYQRVLRRVELLLVQPVAFRRARYAFNRLRLARLSLASGISVPPGVFGRGLSIAHYGSIVVNDQARVGSFCRLHSATNIGVGSSGVPSLGNFVYVAPGAVISGGVHIGDGCAIGANAVVLDDVPPGATAVGVPARVLIGKSSFQAMPEPIQRIMGSDGN